MAFEQTGVEPWDPNKFQKKAQVSDWSIRQRMSTFSFGQLAAHLAPSIASERHELVGQRGTLKTTKAVFADEQNRSALKDHEEQKRKAEEAKYQRRVSREDAKVTRVAEEKSKAKARADREAATAAKKVAEEERKVKAAALPAAQKSAAAEKKKQDQQRKKAAAAERAAARAAAAAGKASAAQERKRAAGRQKSGTRHSSGGWPEGQATSPQARLVWHLGTSLPAEEIGALPASRNRPRQEILTGLTVDRIRCRDPLQKCPPSEKNGWALRQWTSPQS